MKRVVTETVAAGRAVGEVSRTKHDGYSTKDDGQSMDFMLNIIQATLDHIVAEALHVCAAADLSSAGMFY